ncbi:MAG: diaminopimelate epimerase [Bacteroidia bacterium]
MPKIRFSKYHGTGNDFVIIEDLDNKINLNQAQIASICSRRFGVGADGLMLLRKKSGYDFEMVYFNSDGYESTMCGNGGRCIVAFAKAMGVIKNHTTFIAIDGEHNASISNNGLVSLGMVNVEKVKALSNDFSFELFTGSPHYVSFTDDNIFKMDDFIEKSKSIRFGAQYHSEGINVNQAKKLAENHLQMRTYERGVENETYSCGTGAVAAAIAFHFKYCRQRTSNTIKIDTLGGQLNVSFSATDIFSNIVLTGPAKFVFNGEISI